MTVSDDTTFAARRPRIDRAPRQALAGTVRLFVAVGPWRIAVSLSVLDVSASGLGAAWTLRGSNGGDRDTRQLLTALGEGDALELQIEPFDEELPLPIVSARLVRRRTTAAGIELGMRFTEPQVELAALAAERAHTSPSWRG